MAKPPKCRICKESFERIRPLQMVCTNYQCAIEYGRKAQEKAATAKQKAHKADIRVRREKLKSKSDWLREAQAAFNKYIRLRDHDKGCISCGTKSQSIQYCAGHFLTRGAHPELRFNEENCHKQCNHHCNQQLSGNISNYRPMLLRKIGQERLDILEGPHEAANWTIEDIKAIKAKYTKKVRELEKSLENRL